MNMYLSSTAMTRLKTRPAPLSQVSVTGWSGVSVLTSAVQTVSRLGVLAPLGADEAGLGPIGVGRAARREQADQRALLVDRLVIVLEHEIVELTALEVDRAAEARRVDRHALARRQAPRRPFPSPPRRGPRCARRRPCRLALASPARSSRPHWPGSGLGLRLQSAPVLVLIEGSCVKILPARPSPGPTARWRE